MAGAMDGICCGAAESGTGKRQTPAMLPAHGQSTRHDETVNLSAGRGSVSAARLAAVRSELARLGVGGFIVPRPDEHLGEYVPACAERLAWLTGFTGSAGLAVVL